MMGWRERGDEKAARRLVELLSPLMTRVAFRLLNCRWAAEDAVQTAWMRLFRSLNAFDLRIPVSAWAMLIVKRVCSNMLRSLSRHPVVEWDDLSWHDAERSMTAASPDDGHDAREELRQVLSAISMLPEKDRMIMNFLVFEGARPDRVARLAGLSSGALRARTCRIRSRLRSMAGCSRDLHERSFT
jgi:RNA polymerase sigma-70 factor (ECF subfamily)